MDKPPLTPRKIQKLINLAQDKSFRMTPVVEDSNSKSSVPTHEISSGILDIGGLQSISINQSTCTFNPGEMTGRSTGTEEMNSNATPLSQACTFDLMGRHSLALDSYTSQFDKQTSEVHDIMRHSIATNYSFNSKRDLTADEVSLIMREAPLPVPAQTTIHSNFPDNSVDASDVSVGTYFKNKCPEFGKMLGQTESPDRFMRPSITDVSINLVSDSTQDKEGIKVYNIDDTLDCIPVKQSSNSNIDKRFQNQMSNTSNNRKVLNFQNKCDAKVSEVPNKAIVPNEYTHPSTSQYLHRQSYNKAKVPDEQTNSSISQYLHQQNLFKAKVPYEHAYPTTNQQLGHPSSDKMSAQRKVLDVPISIANKSFKSYSKPTDIILKNLQQSLRLTTEDTEGSADNSLSISKIKDYLGKQSNVSVTDMLKINQNKKRPLTEIQMNNQAPTINKGVQVTYLKDTRKAETASSTGTATTVISVGGNTNENNEMPDVLVTPCTLDLADMQTETNSVRTEQRTTKSGSPLTKSPSSLSTIQENCMSFRSGDSPLQTSRGEKNTSHVRSPIIQYKELDKSVDWREVLEQKRLNQEGLAKEQWTEIYASPLEAFVGVSSPATITITTLSDSWLTAILQFDNLPNQGRDLTIELPRFPILLSPGKSEQLTMQITCNVEMKTSLSFTVFLKDASVDGDIEQKGELNVTFKMPVIQALSGDGVNKISFPPIQERTSFTKSFILISDCPVDLQLVLSIIEGDSMFSIKNVQEIKKVDVNKVLMDSQGGTDEGAQGRGKNKPTNRQLCRLTSGNAIKITVTYTAPKLAELQITETSASFNGKFNVNLIGVDTVLKKLDLVGAVGCVKLNVKAPNNVLQLTNEKATIHVSNMGSIKGCWNIQLSSSTSDNNVPFKVSTNKIEIRPGVLKAMELCYIGPKDSRHDGFLIFEDVVTGAKTRIEISGGTDKPKSFPLKTNHSSLSWVRAGRKELSLKNSTDKKVHIRCQIIGEGFSIDLPGLESRGIYCIPFGPHECRPLPIIFATNTYTPHVATLHLVFDKNSDYSRKVPLFGCASGESVRWMGLVTYGDTALVRAVSRAPIELKLYNKAPTPAFVFARVHFNLQYMCVSSSARVSGCRRVVSGRAVHCVSLRVDWERVERRARDLSAATALATLTVLTGAELTRHRILRILRNESTGELDTSLLPDHLKVLADTFEGEDPNMSILLSEFHETKGALNELLGGLQEMTAQIDLPQDFADENTIIITDDTVLEHHTLCD